jgi:hypothetical protein
MPLRPTPPPIPMTLTEALRVVGLLLEAARTNTDPLVLNRVEEEAVRKLYIVGEMTHNEITRKKGAEW